MWETLANVDGDSSFLDNKFMSLHGGGGGGGAAFVQQGQLSPSSQEMQDIARAEALSRQEADRASAAASRPMQTANSAVAGGGAGGRAHTDAELVGENTRTSVCNYAAECAYTGSLQSFGTHSC